MLKSQDQDLLVRSFMAARFANVPEVLLGYRESRLDWKKNLTSRKYVAISFFQNHWQDGHQLLAVRAVAGQLFKSLVDLLAISTGLDYQILRHRARPITAAERRRWQEVWTSVNDGLAPSRAGSQPAVSEAEATSPAMLEPASPGVSVSSIRETCGAGDDRCLAC